jgi:peptidoglycan/xylan/chitin deacetylase (PgdA/CDA1 family)
VRTRQREYYIGGRPRRRAGRRTLLVVSLIAIAVAVVGGAAATGRLPAIGLLAGIGLPGQSTPPVALATPQASAVGSSPATSAASPLMSPLALLNGSTSPSSPAPSVPPLPETPLPCRPPANIQTARVISHGDFKQKVVALTFDDGTNPENTKQILRILQKEKVNATFFPTGVAMERFPDVWKAVARAKFPIANHTYAHGALAGKCFEPQRHELARAAAVFASLGIAESPYMRPPYELWDETTEAATSAVGLEAVILWNVDTGDWQGASAATIKRIALTGGKGSIILMHTFPEATAAALPGIIKGFKARGFRFVTIGQVLGIDGPVPYPTRP